MKHLIFSLLLTSGIYGQINKPSLSPRVKSVYEVGLSTVKLDYGQPSMRGRIVFGGLVPYDKLWRTGANRFTKISFETDVTVEGNKVPKGEYSLYSIPGKKQWTIILNKGINQWGTSGYEKSKDLVRFKVDTKLATNLRETFTIFFEDYSSDGATMVLAWEQTEVQISVEVDSKERILKEIHQKLIESKNDPVEAQTYFDGAQYYHLNEIDLELALSWYTKAIELKPKAFWYIFAKAELAAKLGKLDLAENLVYRVLELVRKSSGPDFGFTAKSELLLKQIGAKE